jgi:hypothetical protein
MIAYVFVLQCVLAIGVGFSLASAQDPNMVAAAKREGRVVWPVAAVSQNRLVPRSKQFEEFGYLARSNVPIYPASFLPGRTFGVSHTDRSQADP